MTEYKERVIEAMEMLGKDPRTIFIGQTVGCKGSAIYTTLQKVPVEKRIELPVMEDVQMGMTSGMALKGYIPISVYPRFDFLVLATNQLVNHLDKFEEMSDGAFKPRAIIRTMTGSKRPLDAGPQHTQDHTEAYRLMLRNMNVIRLEKAEDIIPAYARALESDKSSLLVEIADLY